MNFEPGIAELVQTGATATMLLDGIKHLCDKMTEACLKKMDHAVGNGTMTPEVAVSIVSELHAYRSIVQRQQREIEQGRAAARRQVEEIRQ